MVLRSIPLGESARAWAGAAPRVDLGGQEAKGKRVCSCSNEYSSAEWPSNKRRNSERYSAASFTTSCL